MKTLTRIIFIGIILLNITCISIQEISTFKDLSEAVKDGDLQIIMSDTTVYYVDYFSHTDSTINISGEKSKNGLRESYRGTLFFKDIAYIQTTSGSIFKTIAFIGATGFLVYSGATLLGESSGIETIVKIIYPHGGYGSSCPFIYAWDGNKYNLQGEAFGISLGKALESETSIILPDIEESETELKLKVTNERLETHFFNKMELIAIETDPNQTVYANNLNSFCAISSQKEIYRAKDINKTDITDLIAENDDKLWKSDLFSATSEQNFEDVITVELKNVNGIDTLSLVVSAINTEISSAVFKYLQTLLGDEFANFTKAAEDDPEVIEILKKTLYRSALKFDIWDGSNWKYVDLIYPEANAIKFNKLVRLPVIKDEDEKMKIRLRCMSDVWEIDAVKYDGSKSGNFILHQPKLLDCKSDSRDPTSNIHANDNLYVKLLPGQTIFLVYEPIQPSVGRKITYAVKCQGYLYEWIVDNSLVRGDLFKDLSISTPKLMLVKQMLTNLDNILPVIYDEWKKNNREMVLKSD